MEESYFKGSEMSKIDRFLIGYTDNNSGLQTNVKPFLIPDNAFAELENMYISRGRVRKRLGSVWMGQSQLHTRLRYLVTTTDEYGDATSTAPGTIFAIGQMFSIGEDTFTVTTLGTPVSLLSTNPIASMTYNTTTGAIVVSGADPLTDIFFYPATPVMGLTEYYIPASRTYQSIGFDTQFSYKFDELSNAWLAIKTTDAVWTGNNSQFFWSTNYQGSDPNLNLLWTTNFNTADGIRYFNGTSWTKASFSYNNAGDKILTARILIQFKNRLLLMNTVEQVSGISTSFFNRVRYSALGNPLSTNAWNQDVPGRGSAIDAPVQEELITAQFIKDRLIVYFKESTFELAYTGNQVQPFVWQKINTELGAESTFSEIPFDRNVFGIDNIGIHACNGANVERIDEVIPQLSFGFSSAENGPDRIAGIRDYYSEIAYWTYPNQVRNSSFYFPNKTLIFNYINNTWSTNDDSITAFGYFLYSEETPGATWGNTYIPWEQLTMLWNSQADTQTNVKVKTVIAGNQQGYVVVLQPGITSNAAALQVTNVTSSSLGSLTLSCINHNLSFNDFVLLSDMNGLVFTDAAGNVLPNAMARVSVDPYTSDEPHSVTLSLLSLNNVGILQPTIISGIYTGGGVIARVSQINLLTKQYNFYTAQDRNVYVSKVDFLVDATRNGEVTVDFFISSSSNSMLSDSLTNGSLLGNNALETYPYALAPFEQFQSRLWHPLYFYAEGECVQFNISMSPRQMFNYSIEENQEPVYTALQDFQLNAMVIYAQPTSSRMQ